MRIAIVAHVRQKIAQPFCGGMESHSWYLAEGLQQRGHDVVLFASGDSDARFTIDPVIPEHHDIEYPWYKYRDDVVLHAYLDASYARACDRIAAGGFDVVHNNSLHRFPLECRRTAVTPTVTSLHIPPYDALHWFVAASPAPQHHLTVTSQSQLAAWWPNGAPPEASVLHNGIDIRHWPFIPHGDGSAAWCGRITPNKGTHLAIRAAMQAGLSINLFGLIEDPEYWAAEVQPLLGDAARYRGHLIGADLAAELGRSSVFLFTPCWNEPFGLAAVEAMSCGLPVAAFDVGAAREVIGEAGAFGPGNDIGALAAAIQTALTVPRTVARNRAAQFFTQDLWLERCEKLYAKVIAASQIVTAS